MGSKKLPKIVISIKRNDHHLHKWQAIKAKSEYLGLQERDCGPCLVYRISAVDLIQIMMPYAMHSQRILKRNESKDEVLVEVPGM